MGRRAGTCRGGTTEPACPRCTTVLTSRTPAASLRDPKSAPTLSASPRRQQPNGHIPRRLLERKMKTERRIQRLTNHAFPEASVELLHFRARSNLGEELLADRILLAQRRQLRFHGVVVENAAGAIELDHAAGQPVQLGGAHGVGGLEHITRCGVTRCGVTRCGVTRRIIMRARRRRRRTNGIRHVARHGVEHEGVQ